ncbi:hypothetical protein BC936DRAFT_144338 [Jimgerdemannia flammicorona]|uniref:Uncharacterized protein n=1 Tax=Jimgerdemannia flammicorona TaxID=994334 RepID=A0A433DM26_9FUNG|nr:hypothetical protein BC936DRAFT_144338 [Jimgerdemannia flammicorona]
MPFTHSCVPMGFSSQGGLDITRAPMYKSNSLTRARNAERKRILRRMPLLPLLPWQDQHLWPCHRLFQDAYVSAMLFGFPVSQIHTYAISTCRPKREYVCRVFIDSSLYCAFIKSLQPHVNTVPSLRAPRQHALVASATEVTALISSEGYWNTLTIPLNHETGKFEIISIDAFERTIDRGLNTVTNFIIAVAAFQTGGSKSNIELNETDDYCLRIYGASTAPSVYLEETLFNIGGSFQVIKLKAAPMHLSHINITQNGRCQTAIILSATDGIVHVYLEVGNRTCRGLGLRVESFARLDHRSHSRCLLQEPVTAEFFEVDVEEYFSILGRMSTARLNSLIPYVIINRGSVLSLDIFDEEDTRVVVAGSQSGELHMAVYQIDKMVNGLSGWSSAFGFV